MQYTPRPPPPPLASNSIPGFVVSSLQFLKVGLFKMIFVASAILVCVFLYICLLQLYKIKRQLIQTRLLEKYFQVYKQGALNWEDSLTFFIKLGLS